jgi:hypothetical protein
MVFAVREKAATDAKFKRLKEAKTLAEFADEFPDSERPYILIQALPYVIKRLDELSKSDQEFRNATRQVLEIAKIRKIGKEEEGK